jgi:hypothetical protein
MSGLRQFQRQGLASIWLAPEIAPLLAARELRSLDQFLAYDAGDRVSRASKRPVRTLTLDQAGVTQRFYLKQFRISLPWLVTEIGKRRWPLLAAPTRELRLLDALAGLGLSVMETVGWGERRLLGLPLTGFLLVREVQGREYVSDFLASSPRRRRRLRRAHGELVGILHRAGLLTKVRPNDLFVTGTDLGSCRRCLTVIDRERGLPDVRTLTLSQRVAQLADLWVKSGIMLGLAPPREALAFLAGYFSATGTTDRHERALLVRRTREHGARLIARHQPAAEYRKSFAEWYP